ncbi:MAG: carboxypeptidase-like regulatory domain-containing protein [Bacteroidales bacterium]|nr:carboxypeptidase-like regulatory domain-containing protein [Bacteroidales bacterium]
MKPSHFIIVICLLFSADLFAQLTVLDTLYLTEDFSDNTLEEICSSVERDYPVRFFYDDMDSSLLNLRYTGMFQEVSLGSAFNRILSQSGHTLALLQTGSLVIVPDSYKPAGSGSETSYSDEVAIGDTRDRGKYHSVTLSGTILDGKFGAPLIGVVIYSKETDKGAVTGPDGAYSITLTPGKHTLQFSSVGFESIEKKVEIISSGALDLSMYEENIAISEVIVSRKRPDKNVTQAQMGTVEITAKEIKTIPTLMGEADVIKSLTLMPGVQSVSEASAGFNIRGGNVDQNLILIDGISLFNTSHLFGFFSTIHPEVISDVTLYKGNIPASFGGRVSSVMDIGIKDNPVEKLSVNTGIGLINARANVEVPIIKDKLWLVAGGRSTYSDWILKRIADPELQESSAGFYDIIGKLRWQINRNNSLSVFAYQSSDRFDFARTSDYLYGNQLGNIKYQHIFSNRLSISLLSGISIYKLTVNSESYDEDPNAQSIASTIRQHSTKLNLTYIPFRDNTLHIGAELNRLKIHPGELTPLTGFSTIESKNLEPEQGAEMAFYINDQYTINSWLALNMGFRYSSYRYLGPKTVYGYDPESSKSASTITDTLSYAAGETIASYGHPEPRLSLRFLLNKRNSIKLGYNHSAQYIQLLSNTAAATPTDIWKLSDSYIEPLISDQMSLGFFRNFLGNTLETSVEIYYKKIKNLIDYKNGAIILLNEHIETDIVGGMGRAYGLELMVRKNSGNLTGWISYTYSRTLKNTRSPFPEDLINNGAYYPAAYDKPHDISTSLNYRLSRRWSVSGNFIFSSGRPATLPEYQLEILNRKMVYFSDRNKYRLPDYHRLDLSVTFHGHIKAEQRYISSWTFSVFNVYGRSNPYSVYYTKDQPTQANDYKEYILYQLSIVNQPIPTISYNFRF